MSQMERTETLEELRDLHITLEKMRYELELGHGYPPQLKRNLDKTTEKVVGFKLSVVQNPEELLGVPKMIDIMDSTNIKKELADSLYDKVSENSTKWAESEDFEEVTRKLISTYERMRPEVDGQSSLEEINEKTTELSKLLPPPNTENFYDRIRNTASITELHLLRNHLRSQKAGYDEGSYKEVKDLIYQRLGELMLTQYHYAEKMDDLVEGAEDILRKLPKESAQEERIASKMLTASPFLNDILDGKEEITPQELKTARILVQTINKSINEE